MLNNLQRLKNYSEWSRDCGNQEGVWFYECMKRVFSGKEFYQAFGLDKNWYKEEKKQIRAECLKQLFDLVESYHKVEQVLNSYNYHKLSDYDNLNLPCEKKDVLPLILKFKTTGDCLLTNLTAKRIEQIIKEHHLNISSLFSNGNK